jgi:transcriptional regulator with XRE-family HTH domain
MSTWSEKVHELHSAGWTLTDTAREIGLSVQSLSDIKQGRTKEPTGMAAVKLHALHRKHCSPQKPKRKAA